MTEKEYIERIGKRIEEKREALGLSREEFAKKAKLNRMQIYRVETAVHSTSITVLRKIATALKTTVAELIDVE